MAQKGARGGRLVAIDDIYERNAQLETFFQRMEEWFDALSKQLDALAVGNWPQNFHINLRYVEEEEDFDIKKDDYDIKEEDGYIERVCVVNWESPPIFFFFFDK